MAVRPVPFIFIALVCGLIAFQSASLDADEPPTSREAVPASSSPPVDQSPLKLTPEQIEKKRRAAMLMVAITGTAIAGLSLVALAMLWAGRLRRQLRQPDTKETSTDRSFWFLKPPKPSITRSSLPELNRPLDAPPPPASPPPPPEPE